MAKNPIMVLHDATLHLLEHVGVRVESEAAREMFVDHAVRVDPLLERVYPGPEHVAQALATAPATFAVHGRRENAPLIIGGSNVYLMAGGGAVRVLTLDGQYVQATWEHLRQFNTLLDALPHIHLLSNQVDPRPAVSGYYRRIAAEMLCGSSKPCCLQAGSAADVTAMAEMGRVVRGCREALAARPVFITCANAEPPLCIPVHAAEILMEASRHAIPCGISDYTLMGITAPITTAGALVQRNAVQLTALLLAQCCRPGTPFYYNAGAGSANMRTHNSVTANPAAARLLRGAVELGRSYNLPVCGLACTDAKQPDAQAASEMTALIQLAMAAGAHVVQGPTAMMDQMMLSSFAQAVIDNDIAGYLLALRAPLDVSHEMLALDAIEDVAVDLTLRDLKFATHSHTAAHLCESEWRSAVFSYETFAAWEQRGSRSLREQADALARNIIREHHPEPLAADKVREIHAIAGNA